MGAKTAEQTKKPNKPRPPVKCDVCGRKFLTASAWKSHYKFLHAKPEPIKRVPFKKQENASPVKKMVPLHMLKRVNPPQTKEVEKSEDSGKATELAAKSPSAPKKPEFECPVCADKFPVYFTAFRHIQKTHCIDDQGEKVLPNSPLLVKPIRIETCASCSQEIRSTIPHDCPKMQAYKDQYLCLGCDQVFCGLVLFQHHVKGLHADKAQNYFFPSRNEFESWKTELQETTNIEFVRLNKLKAKEIYHCTHQSNAVSTATRLCPASITVREYSRGIHVCYFTEHFGHRVGNVLLKNHNQYSISLYTKETEGLTLEVEDYNDLYIQFKNMIMCIINDAAKADVSTLRDLLGRALEMTTVLKNCHGEDHSTTLNNKSLSDDQISKTLGNLKPKSKRKQSFEKKTETVVAKKIKKTPSAVENGVATRLSRNSTAVNKSVSFNKSIPKKNEVTTDKELEELLEEEIGFIPKKNALMKTPKKKTDEPLKGVLKKVEEPQKVEEPIVKKPEELPARSIIQSPSSFNDSYKHFVDQNFKNVTDTSTPKTKANNVRKKEVVKTKIGQFKVKSVSPKVKPASPKVKPASPKVKLASPKVKLALPKVKPASPKNVTPKSTKIVKEVVKEVVNKVPITPVPFKAKPDIKYVVKEQENDCNILILKI